MVVSDLAWSPSVSTILLELARSSNQSVMTFGHGASEMVTSHSRNLVFQGETHPLVCETPRSLEDHCLKLIHSKAYEVAAQVVTGKVVLDLGCNNGYGTRILAEHAQRIIGVDVSASAIAAAKKHGAPPNVEFRLVDGDLLPFPRGTFDCLVSFQVIEHVVNVDAYLREVVRVLAPHGIALFTTPNRHIRLDPGMKPWNRFHVVEFGASDLADAVCGYFMDVDIRGLFAIPEIYDVEYARVQRSRQAARSQVRRAILRLANLVLPTSVLRAMRGTLAALLASHPTAARHPTAMARLSTADLYYQTDNLDSSLDLMAICTMDGDDGQFPTNSRQYKSGE